MCVSIPIFLRYVSCLFFLSFLSSLDALGPTSFHASHLSCPTPPFDFPHHEPKLIYLLSFPALSSPFLISSLFPLFPLPTRLSLLYLSALLTLSPLSSPLPSLSSSSYLSFTLLAFTLYLSPFSLFLSLLASLYFIFFLLCLFPLPTCLFLLYLPPPTALTV